MRNKSAQTTKGFTLIELLVVIAIIGILAAVVMLAINPLEMQRRGRDSNRFSDLENLRKAIDMSITDGKTLLGTAATPITGNSSGTKTANSVANYVQMDVSTYISTLPRDPLLGNTTTATACPVATPVALPAAGWEYYFRANGSTYELNAYMEAANDCAKAANDGGGGVGIYETGTSLSLL